MMLGFFLLTTRINMPNLALVYDRKFKQHQTPEAHPESPHRLSALERALQKNNLHDSLTHLLPRAATENDLVTIHDAAYVEELERTSKIAADTQKLIQPRPDTDTWISPRSYDTAKLAAGAGLVAVDTLASGDSDSAFVAIRPPGHHALANRAYGFCLFNNVAVAARYAQQKMGLKRVLIIDWDVHHGNGTQDLFYNDPSVCFASFHQYPLWPADCGWFTEDGVGAGRGYNVNIPLPSGTGDRGYLRAWDNVLAPIAQEYQPQLIIVSAGYDAHQFDPLGQQQVTDAGYVLLSQRLQQMSVSTGAKVACFLEGGYNTKTMSESAATTMRVLSGAADGASKVQAESRDRNEGLVDQQIEAVRQHYGRYWRSLRTAR